MSDKEKIQELELKIKALEEENKHLLERLRLSEYERFYGGKR